MTTTASSALQAGTVHVVVTCANRKTVPVPAGLRLDSVPRHSGAWRAREWIRRLAGLAGVPFTAARDLYAGEHWMVARGLPGAAGHAQVRLWVCSAGYGLIPADAQVRPYAAAFSGPEDRVPGGADGARQWWQALAGWEGPAPGQPRSITSLAAGDPSASFLLALSAAYLDACRDDIATAATQVSDPDTFMVVSAGARFPGSTAGVMVPASARLQSCLGGTRQALNIRIAAHLLAAGISGRAAASRHLMDLITEQPPLRRYERKKLTDHEVRDMITRRLAQEPGISATRLLRELRDSGYACEQQRFGQLHRVLAGGAR
jgi:hypothetical protein